MRCQVESNMRYTQKNNKRENNNKTTQKWTNNEYAAKNAYSTLNIPDIDG